MVMIATGLGRSGLQEWLIQRITAIILGVYFIFICGYCLFHPNFGFDAWHELFQCSLMRYGTLLTLLALIAHAWIGIWTIATDYLKLVFLRLPFLITINLLFVVYVIWGIQILWS